MVGVITWKQICILYEHGHRFQDKREEELDVNEVPGTSQPPVGKQEAAHYITNVMC